MNALPIAGIVFACSFGGLLLGILLKSILPDPHLSADSKDAIKMGTGLIASMAALVIGLLTASAKSSFDSQRGVLQQMAANVVILDRTLSQFGEQGNEPRRLLRHLAPTVREHLWPATGFQPQGLDDPLVSAEGTAMFNEIRNLHAVTEAQQLVKSQAVQICAELAKLRWQLNRWEDSALPVPFLVVLQFWLAVLFLSFGLLTPPNGTVVALLFVCAVSVAGALFLIVELDQPFAGILQLSSAPFSRAIEHLEKVPLQ